MKKTKALLLISLSSALVACGGGVDQPKPVSPSSSVAVSSSSAVVSSSSVAVSSSSAMVSSSSLAESSSSVVVSSSSVADSSSSVAVSSAAPSSAGVSSESSAAMSSSSAATANKVARLADTTTTDNGELRWNIPGTTCSTSATTAQNQKTGKLKVSFLRTASLTGTDPTKTPPTTEKQAYITLFNHATSTSSKRAVLDLQILNTATTVRDQDASLTSAFPLNVGQWQTLEATWDYKGGAQAEMTLMIDGANKITYTAPAEAINGVCAIAFRVSDVGSIIDNANMAFYVDDWSYYSDVAGTSLLMSDDFEAYTVGTDLAAGNLVTGYEYHSNTVDASVVELAK